MFYYNDSSIMSGNLRWPLLPLDGTSWDCYEILPNPTSIVVEDNFIYIGYQNFVTKYDHSGTLVDRWTELG